MADPTPTDEQVLADPGAYTVEQVTDVFARAAPSAIETAKAAEAAGKARQGIAEWEPQPTAKASSGSPRAVRYDPAGWRERARSEFNVSPHAIAGALHNAPPDELLTKSEVKQALGQFLDLVDPGTEPEEPDDSEA